MLGQCEPGEAPGCGSSSEEIRPQLISKSRRRGQPIRTHHPPDSLNESNAVSPSNFEGDILQGAESVKSEQLQHPGDGRPRAGGQATAAGFQEIVTPEPRIITISPRIPVADSIRSTTGGPIQFQEGNTEAPLHLSPNQFLDETGNSVPFSNGAANSASFRTAAANDAPFFDGQFQQQKGDGRSFIGQPPGLIFGSQSSGYNGRSVDINGQIPNFTNQRLDFDGQSSGFAPGFSNLNPIFGKPGIGLNGHNAGFAGHSSGLIQTNLPVGGQGPAFVGQDSRFVAQEPVFNAPPPNFNSGVPFAFREFGGVPTSLGVSQATPTDTEASVGSAGGTGQADTDVGGTPISASISQQEPAHEASHKVERLSGNRDQLAGGNNPARFPQVVADNTFQPGPRSDNEQIGFQQNGFQSVNGGFPVGGRIVGQQVNNFQPVSQRRNPFALPTNSPGFPTSDGRFIQGNLEILFPQQFRDDPNGFSTRRQPTNSGVFQTNPDGFITDQERFSPNQHGISPSHQGFFPGQASFPQEQDRFLQDQNNFQTIDGRFSEVQSGFPQQPTTFVPDRNAFPPEVNSPTERDGFPPEKVEHPSSFDESLESLNARSGISSKLPVHGRNKVRLGSFSADKGSTQRSDQISLDKFTTNQRRRKTNPEVRINRGKFPLPRDAFFEAKKESKLSDEKPVEEDANQNEDILGNALQNRENIEPVQDELHTGQTRFRSRRVGVLPRPGGNGFNRDAFPLDQDVFQRSRGEQNIRPNLNRLPPEHRSFSPLFPPVISPNQHQFSPSQIFPPDEGKFTSGQGRFVPNEDRFELNKNRFLPNQNKLPPNQNQFVSNEKQFAPVHNRFTPGGGGIQRDQDIFANVPVDKKRTPTRHDSFIPDQSRFTPDQGRFTSNENGILQDQGRLFDQDNIGQGTPRFPVRHSFQPNQGSFSQNLNILNPGGNRLQQNVGTFLNNPNKFQQNGAGFTQDVNSLNQAFNSFEDFGRPREPHNPSFSHVNGFVRNPNQFQPHLGSGLSQFPSQITFNPGRDAFAPPQNGNIHDNRIVDGQDVHEITTVAPPPRIIAPLPKAMIDHMEKSDAEANKDQSAPSAPTSGSAPSAPGRGLPGRRRKPPRHRPPPRGYVDGVTAPSGTAQNRFGLSGNRATTVRPVVPTTHPENRDAHTTRVPLRRARPGGRTSSIIRTRPAGPRRRPGVRRRFNRRRSTTPAPEVITEVSDITGPSGTTGSSGATDLSGTAETTTPGTGRRSRLGKRRRLQGGFRQRARTRLRRPGRKDTTTESTGLAERQADAVVDSTLERPQFVDTVTSPSGDGLLREPSTLDATTVRPDPVKRRRAGALARRRRLRGRQQITRPALSSPSSPASPSAASADETNKRQYRDRDGSNGQRRVTDAAQDTDQIDNTWLDGTTAPTVIQQLQPQPGSRRPPRRRFRPDRRRVNSFQRTDEKSTGSSADSQGFQSAERGDPPDSTVSLAIHSMDWVQTATLVSRILPMWPSDVATSSRTTSPTQSWCRMISLTLLSRVRLGPLPILGNIANNSDLGHRKTPTSSVLSKAVVCFHDLEMFPLRLPPSPPPPNR